MPLEIILILGISLFGLLLLSLAPKNGTRFWSDLFNTFSVTGNKTDFPFADINLYRATAHTMAYPIDGTQEEDYRRFDCDITEHGLWLKHYDVNTTTSRILLIPFERIKYHENKHGKFYFHIHTDKTIQVGMDNTLGQALNNAMS